MISEFPRCATYSAACSHSSIVIARPRFSITGLFVSPTSFSSSKFCAFRVPIRMQSATSATCSTWRHVDDLDDERQPGLASALLQDLEPPLPQTLERVRRGPRLVDVAAQDRRARLGRRLARDHRLVLVLDGARTRDDRERLAPHRGRAHEHAGGLGVQVARDHLVRLADLDHVVDAVELAPVDRPGAARCRRPARPPCARRRARRTPRRRRRAPSRRPPRCRRRSRPASSRRPSVEPPVLPGRTPGKEEPRVSRPGSLSAGWLQAATPGGCPRR